MLLRNQRRTEVVNVFQDCCHLFYTLNPDKKNYGLFTMQEYRFT